MSIGSTFSVAVTANTTQVLRTTWRSDCDSIRKALIPPALLISRRPVELVYQHSFREVTDAIKAAVRGPDGPSCPEREKQIQGWSRRKKEALICGDIPLLHALSMSTEKRRKLEQRNASSTLATHPRGSLRSA